MRRQPWLFWLIAAVSVLALVGCAQPGTPAPTPTKAAATTPAAAPVASPTKPAAAQPAATAVPPTAVAQPTPPPYKPSALTAPVKVKFGSIGTAGGIATFIAYDKGYYKDEGLDVEITNFRTGGDMIAPLSQGELHVGSGAINTALFNAIVRDISMRVVAANSDVERSFGLVVRADLASQIKDWGDLKGRKVAISGTGNSQEVYLNLALQKAGLTTKDVQIETLGFPEQLAAMANKAIDVAAMTEPSVSQGLNLGVLVRWKFGQDIKPGKQAGALFYSAKFAEENNEAAKRFMVATLRGGRDFYDFLQTGKGKEQMVDIAVKYTTVKDRSIYEGMAWPGVDPDMNVIVASLQEDMDYYVKQGYMKQAPAMKDVVDTQFLEYAWQKLGKLKP